MDKSPKRAPKSKKKAEVKPVANEPDDQTAKTDSGYTGSTKVKKGQPRSLR